MNQVNLIRYFVSLFILKQPEYQARKCPFIIMKKPEKKKTGKKKATAKNPNKLGSKDLQRDFNKRMKILVRDIKKETQVTIKNALKEAKRKLHEGSEFVMNDVLNSIVTTVEGAEEAILGKKEPKSSKKAKGKNKSKQDNLSTDTNEPNENNEPTTVAAPEPTSSVNSDSVGQEKPEAPVVKKPATTRTRKATLTPAEPAQQESTVEAPQ